MCVMERGDRLGGSVRGCRSEGETIVVDTLEINGARRRASGGIGTYHAGRGGSDHRSPASAKSRPLLTLVGRFQQDDLLAMTPGFGPEWRP